ncbi:MAG TPA: DegT/DnrJ/EryC1/StrS family aminotransferase [Chthonomonadaceae bacterium]|nr:DegT/DnrJ/EryC1/StrS family aminotransferase [Chthonomonadaceae bacterium]
MLSETKEVNAALPAIAGGQPAKTFPYTRKPRYGEAERQALEEALQQGTLFYAQGKMVHRLEEAFARACGVKHAIACSSGTTAIHAALVALGISPGDEVITAPITDVGSVIPILYQGAVPVFADLDPRTFTLSPASVEAHITPQTRAILVIHLAGNACDLQALSEIAARHGLFLIEDCAQALGCRYAGRSAGSWGQIGCFSLNEFKHISCGDGGIAITDDPDLALRLRLATDKAYDRRPGAALRQPAFLALNARMTELQGAVALAQLEKLEGIVERRRQWCGALCERLRGLPGLALPEVTAGCEPSWWFYLMRVQPEILGADADTFAKALAAEGLPVSAHYIGQCVYEYPLFAQHSAFAHGDHAYQRLAYVTGLCPEAEAILQTGVLLSVNEGYTEEDLDQTVTAVRRAAAWFATKTPGR